MNDVRLISPNAEDDDDRVVGVGVPVTLQPSSRAFTLPELSLCAKSASSTCASTRRSPADLLHAPLLPDGLNPNRALLDLAVGSAYSSVDRHRKTAREPQDRVQTPDAISCINGLEDDLEPYVVGDPARPAASHQQKRRDQSAWADSYRQSGYPLGPI